MAFFWLWPGPNHPLKTSENGCFLLGFLPHFCYFFIRLLGCFVPYFLFFLNSFLSSLFILFYQFFYPLTRCFLLWIEVFFLEIQGYFFYDEGNEKAKITLSFLGFFECCTALFLLFDSLFFLGGFFLFFTVSFQIDIIEFLIPFLTIFQLFFFFALLFILNFVVDCFIFYLYFLLVFYCYLFVFLLYC
jgi:hypothetical protein